MFEKIKILFGLMSLEKKATEVTKVGDTTDVKPGWQTTEFWGKNLVQIVSIGAVIAGLFGKNISPDFQTKIVALGLAVIGVVEAVYSYSRGQVKSA